MSPAEDKPHGWRWLALGAALFGLNLALSFHNLWPTPWVTTRHELSVEAAALVLLLALWVAWRGRPPSRRTIAWLAGLFALLVLGRYAQVTAPALYGRPVNLFWDSRHLPAVAAMLIEASPWWLTVAAVAAAAALLAGLFLALQWMLATVVAMLAWRQSRRLVVGLSATLVALFAIGHVLPQTNTQRWFSLPVMRTYAQQASFLRQALASDRVGPDAGAPPLAQSNLGRVAGADVMLVFLESYGAVAFQRPEYARVLARSRHMLAAAAARSGRQVVSAFIRSPTFGGASWLAHASFLTGVEVADNGAYQLLLTGDRETLVQRFSRQGYRTLALMPGIRRAWPEGSFYGFDRIYDAEALDYQGPAFGWWRIPDQYALARLNDLELAAESRAPVMLFFTTISSHMPFRSPPPYRSDWQSLLGPEPYGGDSGAVAQSKALDWGNLGPAYADSLGYAMTCLSGYLATEAPSDLVLVVIGDHQPPASVSGSDASWDVPVHVITSRTGLVAALLAEGFEPGMEPAGSAIAPMHRLTAKMLLAFGDEAAREADGDGLRQRERRP